MSKKRCEKGNISPKASDIYKCRRCGATANKKDKLCKPEKNDASIDFFQNFDFGSTDSLTSI